MHWNSHCGAVEMNLTRNHEVVVQSLALLSELRIWRCCELSCGSSRGSDLAWLWLWRRLAAARPIQPLAWELPYASICHLKQKSININQDTDSPSPAAPPGT